MKTSQFKFPEFLKQADLLRNRLRESLRKSPDEKVRELLERLPAFETSETPGASSPPLTVAFVGQYDSGKSTMISALTDRRDIPIDADVCTDKVTAYDWNGIRILDTPGIHAGYPHHDEITYAAINKVDLLIFTITNELFDDVIGAHFRDLCFARNKASETLLVVNKMGQDSGTPKLSCQILNA
jgi:predicted GTPase